MRSVKKVLNVVRFRFAQDFLRGRCALVFAMMLLYILEIMKPLREFGVWAKCGVSPTAFVFLLEEGMCQFVLAGGTLALFAGAPYRSDMDNYLLARTGRVRMALGNCAYVVCVAVIYTAALFGFSMLSLAGAMDLGDGWGKVLRSIQAGSIPAGIQLNFQVSGSVMSKLEPGAALAYALGLETLCMIFLGLLIYVFNRAFQRPVGLWAAGVLVMFDLMVYNMFSNWWYVLSPLSLPRLSIYFYKFGMPLAGSPAYAFLVLGGGSILLIALAVLEETAPLKRRGNHRKGRKTRCVKSA